MNAHKFCQQKYKKKSGRGHPVCGVKMVAIALRVEMKLRGRFTTYPKKRKPKELLYFPGKSDLYNQEKKGN